MAAMTAEQIARAKKELRAYKQNEKYVDILIKDKRNELAVQVKAELASILSVINTLDQPYTNILYMRYICGYGMIEIADKLNYSERQIRRGLQVGVELYAKRKF